MNKLVLVILLLVSITLFGCKRKEQAYTPPSAPAVVNSAPALVPPPAAAPAVAEPAKPDATPGSFAAKKAAGLMPDEKPASFARKVAKPSVPKADAKAEGGAKSFAKKKAQ